MKTIKLKSGTELPLRNLKGKDYLDVCYRVVWFREEHPDWSITTEFVYQNDQSALAKATIYTPKGQIMAESHKEESLKDFPAGFREKAETGAIGRALALCGYGTQFEPDFDEGQRVVDSPMQPKGAVMPEQPDPGDGYQLEGVKIPYGKLAGQYVHMADPVALRDYILELEESWKKRGLKEPPNWAKAMIQAAEPIIAKFETDVPF